MTLLNATLVLGMLAAAVPVVLHLLARQQPKRVVLPSVRFLTERLTMQRSRLRVQRWWLLALRVLALSVLALILAQPMIHSAAIVTWGTIGGLMLAAMALWVMASIAWVRQVRRGWVFGLLAGGVVAAMIALFWSVRTVAVAGAVVTSESSPVAIGILIDNSPSAARSWRTDPRVAPEQPGFASRRDSWAGYRLGELASAAQHLIDHLPPGSRVAMADRSSTPVSFSLDVASARERLTQFDVVAAPVPIDLRMASVAELLQSSDLPTRRVVVVSDLAATAWRPSDETRPRWLNSVPSRDGEEVAATAVGLSVLDIRKDAAAASTSINRWLSLPQIVDVPPSAGSPIPISLSVGRSSDSLRDDRQEDEPESSGAGVAVDLGLVERDVTLPVVRDGRVVRPQVRQVDRVSVEVPRDGKSEVVLTLPPLDLGTHHIVIRLAGADAFDWDNERFLTIHLPTPPPLLIVADDDDESAVMAAALVAPRGVDDPSATYRIEQVGFEDLSAVPLNSFDAMVLVDPPLTDMTGEVMDAIGDAATRGTGVWVLLGPRSDGGAAGSGAKGGLVESSGANWLPKLGRLWRVPAPGTFFEPLAMSHQVFAPLRALPQRPPWGDFRVHRYWQAQPDESWMTLVRYGGTEHAALLVRDRVAVQTTPLPALSRATRDWNELLSGSDAWPAFVTTRGVVSWLAGINRGELTVLAGETAVVQPDQVKNDSPPALLSETVRREPELPTDSEAMPPRTLQLFLPEENSPREVLWRSDGTDPTSVVMTDTLVPGTAFLRGPQVWSGYSVNLDPAWSRDERVSEVGLRDWLGVEGWQWVASAAEVDFRGDATGASATSLHGPLMLLVVAIFLAELVLSNWFYRGRTTE